MATPRPFAIKDPDVTHVVIELFGGDNNLSSFVREDLQEMKAGNRGRIATIALTDTSDGGGQVIELTSRKLGVVEELGEIDTGDPATLADFISRALVTYPKARKAIGFWDHGTGVFDEHDAHEVSLGRALRSVSRAWRSRSRPARRLFVPRARLASQPRLRAMLHDDTSGGVLTNHEAAGVLAAAFRRARVKRVDVIFSDTCLNGMIEVLEQFRTFADVIVGSEDLEPGDGWDYRALFQRMSDAPPKTAQAWGAQMVDAFRESYARQPDKHPCTLAAFNTKNDITSSFAVLVKALIREKRPGFTSVQEARAFTQSFARRDTYDIKDFAGELVKTTSAAPVKKACRRLAACIDEASIESVALGPSVRQATGLAFWLPSDRRSHELVADTYAKLQFDKTTGWTRYLDTFWKRETP